MNIRIMFFDKKSELIVEDLRLNVPEDIIFSAAKSENTQYINSRPFDVSDELKGYVIEHYPHLKDHFDKYLHDFIGREGLPEDY